MAIIEILRVGYQRNESHTRREGVKQKRSKTRYDFLIFNIYCTADLLPTDDVQIKLENLKVCSEKCHVR